MKMSKILLIDDDSDLLRLLRRKLLAAGFEVALAQDGFSAVRVARKEAPDVVVLDLGLPAGSGFEVMERMRQNMELNHIPIVVLTGRDEGFEERTREAGAVAFLRKPVDPDRLIGQLESILRTGG